MTSQCVWQYFSILWHYFSMCVTCLTHTWRIHTCAMTSRCVWHVSLIHDAFIRVPWLLDVCDMSHSYMTHSYVCHDFPMCVTCLIHTWRIHTCDMTTRVSYRVAKTHRMLLIWMIHFPQKRPTTGGSFAKNHLTWPHVSLAGWWRLIECLLFLMDISRQKALQLVVLWREITCNLRHSMGLHHPVVSTLWSIHKCDMTHSYVWQSPVHENGVLYTEVVQWGTTSVHTEVERKYTEVAARGTPVYFRGNLSEKLGIPVKTYKLWGLQWKLENL